MGSTAHPLHCWAERVQRPTGVRTHWEVEILQHVIRGQSRPQIAQDRSLSVRAVEWHGDDLMSKLGVHRIAELVRFALRHGLVLGNE
jgi:DNA-binding NarL/FixJ family response regulator